MNFAIKAGDRIANLGIWLQRNVCEDSTSKVIQQGLYNSYKNDNANACDEKIFGKVIHSLFKVKNVYLQANKQQKLFYEGIYQKHIESRENFKDTVSIINNLENVRTPYAVLKKSENEITVAMSCGSSVNGMHVLKEIVFNIVNYSWKITVAGVQVEKRIIGFGSINANSTANINIILHTVQKVRICQGHSAKAPNDTSIVKVNGKIWRQDGATSEELRMHSFSCHGVLPFLNASGTCRSCLLAASKNKKARDTEDKENIPTDSGHQLGIKKSPEKVVPTKVQEQIDERNTHDKTKDLDLQSLFPGASDEIKVLLLSQQQSLMTSNMKSMKWDKSIIKTCLTIWTQSPNSYRTLKASGLLNLPSESLLQKYKNCYEQKPGFQDTTIAWMANEAAKESHDMHGGIILDEMSIQEDITVEFRGENIQLVGLVDESKACDVMYELSKSEQTERNVRLASHILQFMYVGYDGFRFLFGYVPTKGANGPELYLTLSKAIQKISGFGFNADFVCMDEASANRVLMHMFFEKDTAEKNRYTTRTIFSSNPLTFMMDYSHVLKRVRNNICSSGEKRTRNLKLKDGYIIWDHWLAAFRWDRDTNPMRVHQILTDQHMFLTNPSKMRNKLAEDVLDDKMLNLMECYQRSLIHGEHLDSSVCLLKVTSQMISIFRDFRTLSDVNDHRLQVLNSAHVFFTEWEDTVSKLDCGAAEKNNMLMSRETREDLKSLILGFCAICERRIASLKSITPGRINSDIIENTFCQQRAKYHGANTNPTVAQYKSGITSTILGQSVVSKKSNAFCRKRSADPFSFSSPVPLNHNQRRKMPKDNC